MNVSKGFLLLLILAVAYVSALLVEPFLQFVLAAVLLAYVLFPLHRRLEPRVGGAISALVLVVGATLALAVPIAVLVAYVAAEAVDLAGDIDEGDVELQAIEETIEELTGFDVDIAETVAGSVETVVELAFGSATDVFASFVHTLIGLGLAAFILFYLLKDGARLMAWLRERLPLPPTVMDDLTEGLSEITWAVLVGHVAVAVIQGVIAGLGLLATGVPNVAFFTALMIVLALIPAIGTFVVWAPAAAWLVWTGEPVLGGALFVYGAIVVGISDEFLRPLIVGRADVSPSVIIVGVIGGLYLMGFIGLFFGPIVVASLKVVVETFDEHYDRLDRLST
jgi:predicted PurR-regulated permease PerM